MSYSYKRLFNCTKSRLEDSLNLEDIKYYEEVLELLKTKNPIISKPDKDFKDLVDKTLRELEYIKSKIK